MTYKGRAKILDVGAAAKDSATAEWYEMDPAIGSMVHKPLDNGEVWHLDKKACYALTQGDNLNSPKVINPLLIHDVYLVTQIDEDGYKVKITLEQICINDEDMHLTEQYRPAFIKRNKNCRLYQAQMLASTLLKRIHRLEITVWTWNRSVSYISIHSHTLKSKGLCGCGAAMHSQQVLEAKMPARHVCIAGKQKTSGT
jgi:hypothetical protein